MVSRFPSEVASVIRGLLAEHNVSGARLAEALDRAPSYVSERQTGQRSWTMSDLDVIAELLEIEPTILLAEVSRRARLAKDARDASLLGKPRSRPRAPEPREVPQPRRKRRSA
ncbi:MAG: hypothetical protein U0R80_04105 [Nocardioidaceae bacterium]